MSAGDILYAYAHVFLDEETVPSSELPFDDELECFQSGILLS